jgi:hypothetical protein
VVKQPTEYSYDKLNVASRLNKKSSSNTKIYGLHQTLRNDPATLAQPC